MKVLAIDPGFGRIGIAVIEKIGATETLLFSECFETESKQDFYVRIHLLGTHIKETIKLYGPEMLAIENLFIEKNQKTAMRVSEARGVIIYEAICGGLKVFEYTPLQIKTALTGYGKATKEQVAFMVGKILKLDTKHKIDDELDAIAIGLTHFAYYK